MTSSALLTLRENNPQRTSIYIDLNTETDDAVIAQALEQNPFISYVNLRPAQRNANWDHLFRVLATRGNLVHFVLYDHTALSRRAPTERIRPILQAIQQNASVQGVEFRFSNLRPEELCSFLDAGHHVTDLTLFATGGAQDARAIAEALQRNTNIVTLKLVAIGRLLDTVLEGLVSNTCVRKLVLEVDFLEEAARNALQGLLESTRSIQYFELGDSLFTEQSLGPVAQGLVNGSTVTEITLNNCTFTGEASISLLNQVLEQKQNLRSLAIKDCTMSNQSFGNLCQTIALSKLESFAICLDHNQSRIPSLADTIPSMKIRELVIQFDHNAIQNRDQTLQRVRQALKNNFALQSVKFQYGVDDDAPFVDASAEDETLQFYLERNIRLAQWVEDPATVPNHLWKVAGVPLAAKAGPNTLFRLLRKIGPEVLPPPPPEVLPVGGSHRKRKRIG